MNGLYQGGTVAGSTVPKVDVCSFTNISEHRVYVPQLTAHKQTLKISISLNKDDIVNVFRCCRSTIMIIMKIVYLQ